ncbi:MAG: AmmeMemoRadiSam system protein B [Armatimonadota bacterium]
MSIREPAVAGMFYPAERTALVRAIESAFLSSGGPGSLPEVNPNGKREILGLVSPHAGYAYSGMVAAWAYHQLAEDGLPEIAVILGPNHRSHLPAAALSDDTAWSTPLGEVLVDLEVSSRIASELPEAVISSAAHRSEHSIEVQVPFLQYISGGSIRIVPVLLGASDPSFIERLGRAIASAVRGKNAVLVASTDFTHYESGPSARAKDSKAIQAVLDLSAGELIETVSAWGISMCGVLPTAAAITACRELGASSARLLSYRNSGDVIGDQSEVVGYAALEIRR